MKLLTLLIGIIIAIPAMSQVDTPTSKFNEQWDMIKGGDFPAQQTFKGYKRFVFEPLDTATYIYTITRQKKVWLPVVYDTLYVIQQIIETEDPKWQHVNMTTTLNSNKVVSGKSFSYVVDATKPASSTITVSGSMVEIYSERFNIAGNVHGSIDIYIDNVKVGTFNQSLAPLVTDLSRNQPTYRKKFSTGPHTVSIRSTTGQHMLDAVKVYGYKLQPK